MVDVYAALGHGHQLANLISVAGMFGAFVGLCAYGHAIEKRVTPAPAAEAVKAPAGPAKPLAAVDIPQFLRERNAA